MAKTNFTTGSLVRTRGRDWVVLPSLQTWSAPQLHLRPAAGRAEEETYVSLALERVEAASAFPLPSPERLGGAREAMLLRDALYLSLRSGAGPLRCLGQITCNPYPYQLVPLLMALQHSVVRLLIADGVGLGKTIESGLIARELRDRGDIERMTVLCPPRLVSQWAAELRQHLNLPVQEVTARNAPALQRKVPGGKSLFRHFPLTVVSFDFIKTPLRRDEFARECPELIIVDEAHTCVGGAAGGNNRYRLVESLAALPSRHVVLCTATPHSGKQAEYERLVGLLDPSTSPKRKSPKWLLEHIVQRPRAAVVAGEKDAQLPQKMTMDLTYEVSAAWLDAFAAICGLFATPRQADGFSLLGVISLVQALASSPQAALASIERTELGGGKAAVASAVSAAAREAEATQADAETELAEDAEPAAPSLPNRTARALHKSLQQLISSEDNKYITLQQHLTELVHGPSPMHAIVFCRFIKTAQSVHERLKDDFAKRAEVLLVTSVDQDDVARVTEPHGPEALPRILVATDLLSEGVNLQAYFSAVVHYDLPWNPTRLQQRDGRVDRARQPKEQVHCCTLWASNSPVDGHLLRVLRSKSTRIREETALQTLQLGAQATVDTGFAEVVAKYGGAAQQRPSPKQQWLSAAHAGQWQVDAGDAEEARFGQETLVPADVFPDLKESQATSREQARVQAFFPKAAQQLGAPLQVDGVQATFRAQQWPPSLQAALRHQELAGTVRLRLDGRAAPGAIALTRNHPLVSALADTVLESTLAAASSERNDDELSRTTPRMAVWSSREIATPTVVALLRFRFELQVHQQEGSHESLVEEASALALTHGPGGARVVAQGLEAMALLQARAEGEPKPQEKLAQAQWALQLLQRHSQEVQAWGEERAKALLADHVRVRRAVLSRGQCQVKCLPPFDIVGTYVLVPSTGARN